LINITTLQINEKRFSNYKKQTKKICELWNIKNKHEITELKYTSLIKILIKEENFKWHLEAFASELFVCTCIHAFTCIYKINAASVSLKYLFQRCSNQIQHQTSKV